jgi:cytochrome c-type biogenesis protein CcmH/NrfF
VRRLGLAVAVVAAVAALVLVALRGPSAPRTMNDRVRAVAVTLRCPVCQNLSVADSPSRLAQEMRRTIGRDLWAGQTSDQIRESFVRAYGAWILESPPKRGFDLVAWIVPILLLAGGLGGVAWAVRRWTDHEREAGVTPGGRFEEPGLTPAEREVLKGWLSTSREEAE